MSSRNNTRRVFKNEQITSPEVRLIGEDGEMLGVKPLFRALQKAEQKELDLVLVNPDSKPPVARICDWNRMEYEKTKRQKESRKRVQATEIKNIQMRYKIDVGDLNTKVNQARKFFSKGNKVQFEFYCRGREIAFFDLVESLKDKVVNDLSLVARVEKETYSPRKIFVTMKPK